MNDRLEKAKKQMKKINSKTYDEILWNFIIEQQKHTLSILRFARRCLNEDAISYEMTLKAILYDCQEQKKSQELAAAQYQILKREEREEKEKKTKGENKE